MPITAQFSGYIPDCPCESCRRARGDMSQVPPGQRYGDVISVSQQQVSPLSDGFDTMPQQPVIEWTEDELRARQLDRIIIDEPGNVVPVQSFDYFETLRNIYRTHIPYTPEQFGGSFKSEKKVKEKRFNGVNHIRMDFNYKINK